MSKKLYAVSIPITGYIYDEIEADSAEEATEKLMQCAETKHIEEWDLHEHIVQGNVFYGHLNSILVEEIPE